MANISNKMTANVKKEKKRKKKKKEKKRKKREREKKKMCVFPLLISQL